MKQQLPHQQTNLRRTGARVSSPSSGVRPGARALNLELPTSFGISLLVGALGLLFGGLLFSHSAYAASYLNVSSGSGGTISFGSIKPTSTGTSATTSDTLTIHTDCSVGYSVYVSGQNGKDTNLTNSFAESNNTISTSSNAIGSAGSLSSNTWGLNSENTGTYVGLPTYDDALDVALITKSNVAEASTVPIYYGLKVNTALTPGTYTGDVLYTVIMDSTCLTKTVTVNTSGVGIFALTGASTYTIGSTVTLSYTMNDGYHLGSITATTDPNGDGTGGETVTLTPDENNTTKTGSYTFTMPSDDAIVSAVGAVNTYTIAYDGNGATSGSTESQTNQAYGSDIVLQANGFTRTNYNFLGWSLDSTATSATYKADTSYAVSSLASAAGATNPNGTTITLYAVWEEQVATMQNFDSSTMLLNTGDYTTRTDSRDGESYAIKRLPDGKAWMVENLRLTNYKLTAADSDVESEFDMTTSKIAQSGSSGWCGDTSSACIDQVSIYYDASARTANGVNYGALYNWYTATGGSGTYSKGGNAPHSICPSGWRLPLPSDYSDLDKALGGTGGTRTDANTFSTITGDYKTGNNAGFSLGGWIQGTKPLETVGQAGLYHSAYGSTNSNYTRDTRIGYWPYMSNYSSLLPGTSDSWKMNGESVRCIAR